MYGKSRIVEHDFLCVWKPVNIPKTLGRSVTYLVLRDLGFELRRQSYRDSILKTDLFLCKKNSRWILIVEAEYKNMKRNRIHVPGIEGPYSYSYLHPTEIKLYPNVGEKTAAKNSKS